MLNSLLSPMISAVSLQVTRVPFAQVFSSSLSSPFQSIRFSSSKSENSTSSEDITNRGTVLVVTSGKGGVGKTTTAANISLGLACSGKKVAVVDFDWYISFCFLLLVDNEI